ncbi:peptidase S8/S53 domain-containing protein [Lactarius quietus]|nr:peptidase S8/S53 domain-containing protein [Lactarius quietus]
MNRHRSDAKDATFTVEQVNNGEFDPNLPGGEANLDMQYTQGIAWPTPHVCYCVGGLVAEFTPDSFSPENRNEPFLNWLKYMIDLSKVPQTITTSYTESEQTVPPEYAKSVCDLFMQLGTRGVSLLFSSGNFGVGTGNCKKNDSSNTVEFQPHFPSTCPYVTSVGRTKSVEPELVVEFSSGGFSNVFKHLLSRLDILRTNHHHHYEVSDRGFPDVSAQALSFVPILNGEVDPSHGTSCSMPVVTGLFSLLNDYLISKGTPPLGFLNPRLYGDAREGFNDIKSGLTVPGVLCLKNPGCGTEGFSSVSGWDPVRLLPSFLIIIVIF